MKDQIIQALHKIKNSFGTEVFNNPRQFKAVLSDVPFETDAKKIRNLLNISICEMQVYSRLKAGFAKSSPFIIDNLINEITADYEINPASAKTVIESIAEELFNYKPASSAQSNYNPPIQQQSQPQQPILQSQPIDMEALEEQLLTKLMGRITSANIAIPQPAPQAKTPNLFNSNDNQIIAPKIGSIIKFGKYNWQVLDVQNNAALIITEEIIEKKAYHSNRTAITWADCDLRKYLNGEFINNAKNFSPNDKARIISVMNGNRENQWYDTNGGNETTDSIFLLSLYELVKYFGDSGDLENGKGWKYESGKNVLAYGNDRRYIHDQYDKSRVSKYGNKVSWWWLRSPGYSSDYAAFVYDDGFVRIIGYGVDIDSGGVRPALWLDL